MKPVRRVLLQYRARGIFDAKEVAGMLDTSVRRVNKILTGELNLWDHEFITLSQYYSSMGYLELSYLAIDSTYGLRPRGEGLINGSLLDELRDSLRELEEIMSHSENGHIDKALTDVDELRGVVNRIEAELKNKR